MAALTRKIEQYKGQTMTSDWLTIDRQHLEAFAYSTYLDSTHVDMTISKNHVLGPELVDGFMVLSLLMHFDFADPVFPTKGIYGFNYGLDKVRFISPLMLGMAIRRHKVITEVVASSPTRTLVTSVNTIVTKDTQKPIMYAEWKTLLIDGESEDANESEKNV